MGGGRSGEVTVMSFQDVTVTQGEQFFLPPSK